MNGIEPLLSSPWAQAVGWGLLHSLWQGALIALVLAGALALTRRRGAAVRYGIALGALAAMLVLPVGTVLGMGADLGAARNGIAEPPSISTIQDVTIAGLESVGTFASTPREVIRPALPWLFAGWLAGVALLSFYHLGGWLQAGRLRRHGTRPVGEEWEGVVRRLGHRLGIGRRVAILESAAVSVPAVLGWLRPVILVPASALAGLAPRQLEAVLAHELAHVRRHDYLVNLLQTMIETLLFYHPAVWWVSRQVRVERENCCDDLAVAVCGDRLVYARALADLEGLRTASPRLAMAADGGPGGSLLARVRRLAGVPAPPARRPPAGLAGGLALALVTLWLVAPLAQIAPKAEAAEPGPGTGTWEAERKGDKVRLEMTMRSGKSRWSSSSDYPVRDLVGFKAGPATRFELRRDAGTFLFQGELDAEGEGEGTFTFRSNPAYVREMAAFGYRVAEDQFFQLALHDIGLGFVRDIHSLGYRDVKLQQLISFRIHDVSPALIRELKAWGYDDIPDEQLVSIKIHGVTPEYIRALADAGYHKVAPEQLISMRIHGVTPKYVQEVVEAGYPGVSPQDLISMRIHRVDADFIRKRTRGGARPSVQQLISDRIHGR